MKICTIICEFNPFHNGHKYLLERARFLSGCDFLVCVMSGSFTQRGEIAVLDKFTRARHAILGGADAVLELPTAFSVAPAEIFGAGAVKICSSLAEADTLAFGSERGDQDSILNAARILSDESEEFKIALERGLSAGESYIRAYNAAFESVGGERGLLSSPNDILGVEYAKAILRSGAKLHILPIKRVGAEHGDGKLGGKISSATAIRNNLGDDDVANSVPDFVFSDLKKSTAAENFKLVERMDLLRATADGLEKIFGCTEGLSNALITAAKEGDFDKIVQKCTSKRYSAARINRILCANSLGSYESDCRDMLAAPLYLRPLAVNEKVKDEIFSALSKSDFPLITRGRDREKLSPAARRSIENDDAAYSIWQALNK